MTTFSSTVPSELDSRLHRAPSGTAPSASPPASDRAKCNVGPRATSREKPAGSGQSRNVASVITPSRPKLS